jgi:ribosomal-protein-alanine N-acetyltransferase
MTAAAHLRRKNLSSYPDAELQVFGQPAQLSPPMGKPSPSRVIPHGTATADQWFNMERLRRSLYMQLETLRLILRRPRPADVPVLFKFLGDPQAMRHTHVDASLRACRRRVAVHERRRRHDSYAPWTILTKADCQIIGWGGLYDDPFDAGWGVEIGYFFHPAAWGKGYASELVAACTDVADHMLRLPKVRAFAHPENTASRRILEKADFRLDRFIPEMDPLLYSRLRRTS